MKIYISKSSDIYFNLALENWIFIEELNKEKILFLWKNDPCVVIGRGQNPWFECNLEAMYKDNIPVVRRQSGGGTVYHDQGNLNYTIFSPKKKHDIENNLKLVCDIINQIGFKSYPNKRNDIVIDYNDNTYKISGSAFREKKDKIFHHGTLLVNTDTSKLYNYLHQPIDKSLNSKGVKSHRSKVLNLADIDPCVEIEDIIKLFLQNIPSIKLNFIDKETPFKNKELILKEILKLRDWKWSFGKTLPFTRTYKLGAKEIKIKVYAGVVKSLIYLDKEIDIEYRNIVFKLTYNFNFFERLYMK